MPNSFSRPRLAFFPGRFYRFTNLFLVPSVGATPVTSPQTTPPQSPAVPLPWSAPPSPRNRSAGSTEPRVFLCIASPRASEHSTFLIVTGQRVPQSRRHLYLEIRDNQTAGPPVPGAVKTLAPLRDGLYLYLARSYLFKEYSPDLSFSMQACGVSREELEHVIDAYVGLFALSSGRYSFLQFGHGPNSPGGSAGGRSNRNASGRLPFDNGSSVQATQASNSSSQEANSTLPAERDGSHGGVSETGLAVDELYEEVVNLCEMWAEDPTSLPVPSPVLEDDTPHVDFNIAEISEETAPNIAEISEETAPLSFSGGPILESEDEPRDQATEFQELIFQLRRRVVEEESRQLQALPMFGESH